jgi:hypothetical protein
LYGFAELGISPVTLNLRRTRKRSKINISDKEKGISNLMVVT